MGGCILLIVGLIALLFSCGDDESRDPLEGRWKGNMAKYEIGFTIESQEGGYLVKDVVCNGEAWMEGLVNSMPNSRPLVKGKSIPAINIMSGKGTSMNLHGLVLVDENIIIDSVSLSMGGFSRIYNEELTR
jgi:hypothetical protein